MLKKPAFLLSCSNHTPHQTSTTPLGCRVPLKQLQQQQLLQCRHYAIVADSHGNSKDRKERLPWPETTSVGAIPTPYQIFNQTKGSEYSKRRFYELVKLYHPDRHEHDTSYQALSYVTKLERYRLIVAANDILSDPVKRSAYDCYGAGWNGQPGVARSRDNSDTSSGWGNYSGNGWGGGGRGPSQNATWEDWERWYRRDEKRPQEPRFVPNGAFVSLLVMFAALGGIGQTTRLGNYSVTFLEERDALNDKLSKDLRLRQKETTSIYGTREERIDSFLKQRDPIGYRRTHAREEDNILFVSAPLEGWSRGDIEKKLMHSSDRKDNSGTR